MVSEIILKFCASYGTVLHFNTLYSLISAFCTVLIVLSDQARQTCPISIVFSKLNYKIYIIDFIIDTVCG